MNKKDKPFYDFVNIRKKTEWYMNDKSITDANKASYQYSGHDTYDADGGLCSLDNNCGKSSFSYEEIISIEYKNSQE